MSRESPTNPSAPDLPSPPLPEAADCWALFLDVDGTMVGFVDDPAHVVVPTGLQQTLVALHGALGGALALVSGRTIAELDRLFGQPRWAAAGMHGLERRTDDGRHSDVTTDPKLLARLREKVAGLKCRLPGIRIEDKGASIALHSRENPELESELAAAASAIAESIPGYAMQPGNHVFEIKPTAVDKGRAVETFLGEAPFAGRTPVFLGDDLTDEHAFDVVNRRGGISIRIGHRTPSHARFTLGNPSRVQDWLSDLLRRLATRGAGE